MWKSKGDCYGEGREKVGVEQIKYFNFVAFVEWWVRGCENLIVNYTVYDEIVTECVN